MVSSDEIHLNLLTMGPNLFQHDQVATLRRTIVFPYVVPLFFMVQVGPWGSHCEFCSTTNKTGIRMEVRIRRDQPICDHHDHEKEQDGGLIPSKQRWKMKYLPLSLLLQSRIKCHGCAMADFATSYPSFASDPF